MKKSINDLADPIKVFFLRYLIFSVRLGHFTICEFFLYVTNMQAYQQKMEKFSVSEEKKFYRIGYTVAIISK